MLLSQKTLRIYYIVHPNGWRTGILMRTWSAGCFFMPQRSAYGASEEDVERALEDTLQEMEVRGQDDPDRYLWSEDFGVRQVSLEIHPQALIKNRAVVGARHIPLKLFYAWSKVAERAYRVALPRFEWDVILEDLSLAPEVLGNAISAALLGENPRWVYEFQSGAQEYVKEWSPSWLRRRHKDVRASLHVDDNRMETMEAVAEQWVDKAMRRKLPVAVGPMAHREEVMAMLERETPTSLLLVGPPGVGKTTWVQRLAGLLAQRRRALDKDHHVPRIWATSATQIISGQVYLGMWQERCLKMRRELEYEGDYLFVDHLGPLLREQPGGASIADMFTQAVQRGSMSLIAECTPSELQRAQQQAPGLLDNFHILRLEEPSQSATCVLLGLYQRRRGHTAMLHPQGMGRLVRHLDAFARDQRFPGKGMRFLDWLQQTDGQKKSRPKLLYPKDVSAAYARYSGLPAELISDEHPSSVEALTERLEKAIIGQPGACHACAQVLARFKAGLNNPQRPCGSLFFVGPTGVGKTELTRQLARLMFGDAKRLIRLDMSEYMVPGAAARMMAVGPGVRSLAERVRQEPLSLILLDEIEKAHPEVFDLLLGVLGEGRMTDSLGRLVDFRMALIVMTSNLGAAQSAPSGFGQRTPPTPMRQLQQHFRPEFTARIDRVVPFDHLTSNDVVKIVDLELAKAAARTGLKRRQLQLKVSPEARQTLATRGYDPTYGARPLKRVIEDDVMTPLAVLMARQPSLRQRTIHVTTEPNGTLSLASV